MNSYKKMFIIGLITISFFVSIASENLVDKSEFKFDLIKAMNENLKSHASENSTNDNDTSGSNNNDTTPGNNETDPGANETMPDNNETSSNNNETNPDTNETDPGNNETGQGDNETSPGTNETQPQNNETEPSNTTTNKYLLIHTVDKVYESKPFQVYITYKNVSIGNVKIIFNDQTFYSDKNGYVGLNSPSVSEDSQYNIVASKTGYISDEKWILVLDTNESEEPPGLGVFYGSIRYIENDSYYPIENARVHAIICFSEYNITSRSTLTNSNGLYNISTPQGIYRLEFSKQGFISETLEFILLNSTEQKEINVILEKGTQNKSVYIKSTTSENITGADDAIRKNNLGGEVIINLDENNVKFDKTIILYDDAFSINTVKIDKEGILLTVKDDKNTLGRTILINLEQGIFNSLDNLIVEYDDEVIGMADDINDVLDPNNDESNPEYTISKGSKGLQILISIPSFSKHQINIYTKLSEQSKEYSTLILICTIVIICSLALILYYKRKNR